MTRRIIAITGAAVLVAAWAAADERDSLRMIGEGRALYVTNCAGCHGSDARGLKGPNLSVIAGQRAFDRRKVANHIEGRRDGLTRDGMPSWGQLLEHRWPQGRGVAALKIAKLTRYLESVQVDQLQAQQGQAATQAAKNTEPPR